MKTLNRHHRARRDGSWGELRILSQIQQEKNRAAKATKLTLKKRRFLHVNLMHLQSYNFEYMMQWCNVWLKVQADSTPKAQY